MLKIVANSRTVTLVSRTFAIMKASVVGLIGLGLVNVKSTEGSIEGYGYTGLRPQVGVYDRNYASCANANWPPPGPGDNVGGALKPHTPDKEL